MCLWTAKSWVVPTKVHTVPILELMGSVLLPKLVASVKLTVEKMLKRLQRLFAILIRKACCSG